MKMFRWSGLIAFVLFTTLLLVLGFFFLDGWMKKAVEAAGFSVNGSEVNVGDVDLTLNPLGFRLTDVEVSDAQKPSHNVLQLGDINLDINLPQLFLGNVRINDITIADIETNTERKTPAKVAVKESDTPKAESALVSDAKAKVSSVAKQFPEPADILDAQTQNTRDAVSDAENTIEASKQKVSAAVADLPGDEDLASYKKRIAEIKAIELDSLENIQKTQGLLKSVSTDVATDKLAIEIVKRDINNAVKNSKAAVDAILKAPAEDWTQLKKDYPLNKDSALKVAQLLLGETFFERIDQAKYWYSKARPWLARLKSEDTVEDVKPQRLAGEYIRFPHPDPTAKFQLDNGLLSFVADGWPWQMTVQDVSSHKGDRFKPVQLQLRRGDAGSEALLINGVLDRQKGQSIDTFDLQGKGIAFKRQSIDLAGTELTWVPDRADVSGKIVVTDGELSGRVTLMFPKNDFQATGSGNGTKLVASAVSKIERFNVSIVVSGTITKPSFSVESDLDNQLSSALGDVARAEYEAWLKDVKTQLDAEVARLRKPADDALASLEARRDEVEARIKRFEDEVEAEIRSLEAKVAAERKRLEDKAKAELDAAKQKLDAEKRAAEEAAKKAAEDKLKEEADKLKDKIKF